MRLATKVTIGFTVATIVLATFACSSDQNNGPATCPNDLPPQGAACALPDGTHCPYHGCTDYDVTCVNGTFDEVPTGGGGSQANPCGEVDSDAAMPGGACFLTCSGAAVHCTQHPQCCADPVHPCASYAVFDCINGTWISNPVACNFYDAGAADASDDAAADAGVDASDANDDSG